MPGEADGVRGMVRSAFASDPDFVAILPMFVEHLGRERAELERLGRERDWPRLRDLAHRVKGTGGSYGFADLSARAAALESAAAHRDAARATAALAALLEHIGRIHP